MLQVIIFCCIFPDLGKGWGLEADAYPDWVYTDWEYPGYPYRGTQTGGTRILRLRLPRLGIPNCGWELPRTRKPTPGRPGVPRPKIPRPIVPVSKHLSWLNSESIYPWFKLLLHMNIHYRRSWTKAQSLVLFTLMNQKVVQGDSYVMDPL